MTRRVLLAVGLWIVAWWAAVPAQVEAGGGGCISPAGTTPSSSSGDAVEVVAHCFAPAVLRVAPGDEVTFRNDDNVQHNVIASGQTWGDHRLLDPGDAIDVTFTDPGVYPFACTLHPGMVGAIVVGDGEAAHGANPGDRLSREAGSTLGWLGLGLLAGVVVTGSAVGIVRRRRLG